MSSMDLVAFLKARLDEDEQIALAAKGEWVDAESTQAGLTHLQRHGPARVLAEVEAKRIILAEHGRGEFNDCRRCAPWETAPPYETPGTVDFPCHTLRALALPDADHPDYRQEWAL